MKKILFVTDSCADLPYDTYRDTVKVVPFLFSYKGESGQVRDTRYRGKNNIIRMDTHLIENDGVSYCEALNVLNFAADNDMDVIILYSSGKMSKRNKAAIELAAEDFKKNNMELRVTCVDSLNISQGLGLHLTKLVEMYEAGYSYDEIVMYIVRNIKNYRFDIETDDLDYYNTKERMGIIDRFKIDHGGMSSLLTMNEGKVVVAKRCDDLGVRRQILVDRFLNDADLDHPAAVVYNDTDSWEAEALRGLLQEQAKDAEIDVVEASRVVGSHLRPYGLGLAYKIK